jgi:hypothetical protein
MVKMSNAFGDFRISEKGLQQEYQALLEAYLELHRELDLVKGRPF